MCKKWIVLVVALVLCAQVQADTLSTWLWGDSDALGVRVGTEISENIEVGASALWLPDIESPVVYGIYAILHLPDILELPNPFTLDFLPETIIGHPYFGGKVDWDEKFERGGFSPVAGLIFADILFLEYQFESFDRIAINESKIIAGIRFEY